MDGNNLKQKFEGDEGGQSLSSNESVDHVDSRPRHLVSSSLGSNEGSTEPQEDAVDKNPVDVGSNSSKNSENEEVFVRVASQKPQVSEMREETASSKTVSSLGALYKFSWKFFQEPSYADVLSMELILNSKNIQSEELLRRNVMAEVNKFFGKSLDDKNMQFQDLVNHLNEIKMHYPGDIPTKESTYKLKVYHDQELSGKDHASFLGSELSDKYSNIQRFLKNASVVIDEAQAVHLSRDVQEKRRQHKLLVLALLSQTSVSSSIYRVGGSTNPTQWMYKKIHLIGDSQIRKMYDVSAWEGMKLLRPHLHCKDDLSLFTLSDVIKDLIPKVSVKAKMLVVCSVGLRDVVRSIDSLGIFVTLENTITDMKTIRNEFKSFYGSEHDLLFADILPLDVCKLLELHKETVLVEETEALVSQCNETTLRLVKFAYLLSKNMLMENLSRHRYLPPWELFINPVDLAFEDARVKLTSLSEGFQPDLKKFRYIAPRISYFHEAYCGLSEPPKWNTAHRQIFFVCNEKFSAIDKFWPKKKINEKPTFIFLEEVSSSTVTKSLKRHFPLPEGGVLVVWFDASELFSPFSVSDCTCKPAGLSLDLPRFLTPVQIYDSLILERKNLEEQCGSPNVILTTLCPINFPDYLKSQLSDHGDACQVLEAPPDCFLEKINKYLSSVVDAVNLRITQSNRMRGLCAWDICSFLYKREKDGSLAFMASVSPCDRGPVKPQTAAKIMMCLSQCGQKTVEDLNWLDYCKSRLAVHPQKKAVFDNKVKSHTGSRAQSPTRAVSQIKGDVRSKSSMRAASLSKSPVRQLDARVSSDQSKHHVTGGRLPLVEKRNSIHSTSNSDVTPDQNSLLYEKPSLSLDNLSTHANSSEDGSNFQKKDVSSKPGVVGGCSPLPSVTITQGYQSEVTQQSDCSNQLLNTGDPTVAKGVPNSDVHPLSPSTGDVTVPSPGAGAVEASLEPEQKRVCYGLKSSDSLNSIEQPSRQGQASTPPSTSTSFDDSQFYKPDETTLKNLVASLRAAHENEISKLRANPKSHSKYEQQRKEFIEHALQLFADHKRSLEMDSIEQAWVEYWKLKLEASFANTWKKRVSHLINLIGKQMPLHPESIDFLSRLTRIEERSENPLDSETLTSSEAKLLNKFRKRKRTIDNTKVIQEVQEVSRVALGKKMLAQVQKSWKSMGCKSSQGMLDSAIAKIDGFVTMANISAPEREQFDKLRLDINSFKSFLQKKEGNPYDLDFKSISEITKNFNEVETMEYLNNVLKVKGIENPAREDVALSCNAIKALRLEKIYHEGFVKEPVLNS